MRKSKHSLILWFVCILGAVLVIRLFLLTVAEGEKWQSYADDTSLRAVYETAPRGDILDRNGNIIATSKAIYSVNISRLDITRESALETAVLVMKILEENDEDVQITQEDVIETLSDRGYSAYLPITVAKGISAETANKILKGSYPGIQISTDYIREYPNGSLASHVIGYMGRISAEEEDEYVKKGGYRKDSLIGKDGIEKKYESFLKGTDSISRIQIDSAGQVKKLLDKSSAVKGGDLKLTLDLELQKTAEAALEQGIKQAASGGVFASGYGDYNMSYAKNAEVGAVVALDVKAGEVLAMASYPDFDPNDFTVSISGEKWQSLQSKNDRDPLSPSPLYNVATMSAVQPGSTFKPITALAALSCGLDKNKYLYDDGYIALGNRTYGCFLWNESETKHGYLDLKDAIKVSCNYYFYDIAAGRDFASGSSLDYNKPINNETIIRYAKRMGLGQKTGIEINESEGTLPTENLKSKRIKTSLKNHLLAEGETYFKKNVLKDRRQTRKNIEKIVNWSDKDLTLDEIIGKLKREGFVKEDKIDKLAEICRYTYFNQTSWNQGDTFNISIGQGDHSYTTLQMARYMAVLGNKGKETQVSLIAGDSKNVRDNQESENRDMDYLVNAMTGVTKEKGGSLYGAFQSFPYSVAAKTGTAQRAGRINSEDEREYLRRHLHLIAPGISMRQVEIEAKRLIEEYPYIYSDDDISLRRAVINLSGRDITAEDIDRFKEKYDSFAWTVALAPARDPQIAVAVLLVQGKTSSNAAPILREIIGKYGEIAKWEKSF